MSDSKSKPTKPKKKKITMNNLPPQSGPTDTSNWDDRVLNAPDGTTVIETDQTGDKKINISE